MKETLLFLILSSTGIYFQDIFVSIEPPTITTESIYTFNAPYSLPVTFSLPSGRKIGDMDSIAVISKDKPLRFVPYKETNIRFIVENNEQTKEIYIYTRHTQKEPPFFFKLNNFSSTNDTIRFTRITIEFPAELTFLKTSIELAEETNLNGKKLLCKTFGQEIVDTILFVNW